MTLDDLIASESIDAILGVLTPRQRGVVLLLAQGYSHDEIAGMYSVSRQVISAIVEQTRLKLVQKGIAKTPTHSV